MAARLLLLLALTTALSLACMCVDPMPSVEKVFARSEAVFVGKVTGNWLDRIAVRAARVRALERLMGDRRVEFEIVESFRGPAGSSVAVLAGFSGCTLDFSPGAVYLVYAFRDDRGNLVTSTCQRTVPLALAASDLQVLRRIAIR